MADMTRERKNERKRTDFAVNTAHKKGIKLKASEHFESFPKLHFPPKII